MRIECRPYAKGAGLRLGVATCALALGGMQWAQAQTRQMQAGASAPISAQAMVEQLQSPQPRTRSFRNLVVEAAPAGQGNATPSNSAATGEPRPSLSLLIQFDFNSAKVSTESAGLLNNLATALNSPSLRDARFAVEGHTDAVGAASVNQKLSQTRAAAVAAYLEKKGVDSARLSAMGKGFSELAEPSDPKSAANRRVRIVNLD